MKKALISFVSIVVLLGMVGMASALGPPNGTWTELYSGGSPGQPGNTLSASAYSIIDYPGNPYADWSLTGMTLDHIVSSSVINGGTEYNTLYTGGTLLWGGSTITGLSATVIADIINNVYDSGYITMTGSGGFYMSGLLLETGHTSAPPSHFGDIFIEEVIPARVPEPATLLLLGFGLAGLAGIRRKFKG